MPAPAFYQPAFQPQPNFQLGPTQGLGTFGSQGQINTGAFQPMQGFGPTSFEQQTRQVPYPAATPGAQGGGGGFGGFMRSNAGQLGLGAVAGGLGGMFAAQDEARNIRNQRALMEAQRQQGYNEFLMRDLPQVARSEQANTLRSSLLSGGLTSILGGGGFRGGGPAFGGGEGPQLGAWQARSPAPSLFGGMAGVASDYWRYRPTNQLARMSGFEVETPKLETPSGFGGFLRGTRGALSVIPGLG